MPDKVQDGRWTVQTYPYSIPQGWRVLDTFTGTHGNAYLGLVLAWNRDERKFVVWTWNRESGGFGQGYYFSILVLDEAQRFSLMKRQLKDAYDLFSSKRERFVEHFLCNEAAMSEANASQKS